MGVIIKSVLAGLLAMVVSVIATAIVLVVVLMKSQREIPVGPLYLLIPVAALAAGCYWSWRRSLRPKAPAKPPSVTAVVMKSVLAGLATTLVAAIAYLVWIRMHIPRDVVGLVAIDVRILRWPLLAGFAAGFLWEYWRERKLRARASGA